MQLLQSLSLLQESSALILPDLKKVMQKDKRVAAFLKRDSKFEDLEHPAASLETLKFYMLNNPNVVAHVKQRSSIDGNSLSKWDLTEFRKARNLDARDFDRIKSFVTDVFKDHASLSRGTISSDTMKQLRSWASHSGRYYNLSTDAQRELSNTPALHPSKPIVIYRGLLFMESDFKRSEWDKKEPNGIKFAKAIRGNKKEVDLSWDRPSSWSKSKSVAQRFAMYGPASSNFGATLQSLTRQGKIDGKIGYIVSMLVDPKDVLIDFSNAKATIGQFEDESEVILKPGTYHCRIVKKFTPEGEVEIDKAGDAETAEAISKIEELLNKVASIDLKDVDVYGDIGQGSSWQTPTFVKLLKSDKFQKAAINSTTTVVLHTHDKFIDAAKNIAELLKKTSREVVASDEHMTTVYQNASSFIQSLGKSATAESAEAYRKTLKSDGIDFEYAISSRSSFFDKAEAQHFKMLGDYLNVDAPSKNHIHMTSKVKQSAYIDSVIDAFFKHLGVEATGDSTQKKASFINLLKKATRNFSTALMLRRASAYASNEINKKFSDKLNGFTV